VKYLIILLFIPDGIKMQFIFLVLYLKATYMTSKGCAAAQYYARVHPTTVVPFTAKRLCSFYIVVYFSCSTVLKLILPVGLVL